MTKHDVYEYRGILVSILCEPADHIAPDRFTGIAVLSALPPQPPQLRSERRPLRSALVCSDPRNTKAEVVEALKASATRHIDAALSRTTSESRPAPPLPERRKVPRPQIHA